MTATIETLDASGAGVTVEVDVRPGLPTFTIIGFPDGQVRDLRETLRAALLNAGRDFPLERTTVNIAPAGRRECRDLPSLVLAIAEGVLEATDQVSLIDGARPAVGELRLSGEVRPFAPSPTANMRPGLERAREMALERYAELGRGIFADAQRRTLGAFAGELEAEIAQVCADERLEGEVPA